jgi:hypothetical protein
VFGIFHLDRDPPTYASHVAEITCVHSHTQFCFLCWDGVSLTFSLGLAWGPDWEEPPNLLLPNGWVVWALLDAKDLECPAWIGDEWRGVTLKPGRPTRWLLQHWGERSRKDLNWWMSFSWNWNGNIYLYSPWGKTAGHFWRSVLHHRGCETSPRLIRRWAEAARYNLAGWSMPIILVFRRLRQDNQEFEVSLD